MKKKFWCKHISILEGGYRIVVKGILVVDSKLEEWSIPIPKSWNTCPVRGCGKKRPK